MGQRYSHYALEHVRLTGAVEAMRATGVLLALRRPRKSAHDDFEPIRVHGKPTSDVIIDGRFA